MVAASNTFTRRRQRSLISQEQDLWDTILIHPLLPTSLPVSTPNTIHHSCLTVCLPDSLNLTCCLSILFGQVPVNKLVPATSLLWALSKSRVYNYDTITIHGVQSNSRTGGG